MKSAVNHLKTGRHSRKLTDSAQYIQNESKPWMFISSMTDVFYINLKSREVGLIYLFLLSRRINIQKPHWDLPSQSFFQYFYLESFCQFQLLPRELSLMKDWISAGFFDRLTLNFDDLKIVGFTVVNYWIYISMNLYMVLWPWVYVYYFV